MRMTTGGGSQRGLSGYASAFTSLLLLSVVGLAGRAWPGEVTQAPHPAAGPPAPAHFRNDRILLKPKAQADLKALAGLHLKNKTRVLRTFPQIGNLQVLQLPPGADARELIAAYKKSGMVEYAEPDYLLQTFLTPNDPDYLNGTLWNMHNTGQNGGVAGADIHAPQAWDLQNTAKDAIVAVVDTGIRRTHEDLSDNMWINPGEIGLDANGQDKSSNGIDDDGDGYVDDVYGIDAVLGTGQPEDLVGHGSHVSGIIGAVGDNGVGVVGVAWRVQMMDCKFLNTLGHDAGSISDAITCIDYARSKGANIINASWGGYSFTSTALYDAIRSTRDADMIFVAATGNDGNNNDLNPLYPASYDLDNIIAVMATTRTDSPATWSNFGAQAVSIGAPGGDILSCWNGSDSDYQSISGTSMAAAHVSGVCAVVWQHYPTETYRQIINRVLGSVDLLPSLSGKCFTGGRVNLQQALAGPVRPILSVSRSGNQLQFMVAGEANTVYVVDSSADFRNWTLLLSNRTGSNGEFAFSQTNPGSGQRFFRASLPP